jgi:hypothetical protein
MNTRAFAPGKPFQLCLRFASETRAYPIVAILGAPLEGRQLALPTNIALCSKGLLGQTVLLIINILNLRIIECLSVASLSNFV